MIALARAEEKLVAIEKNNHNNFDRMNRFSQKLDDIEKKVDDNARTVSIINKVVYLSFLQYDLVYPIVFLLLPFQVSH